MRCDPPRDLQGNIIPHDHAEILDDHHVIRHTNPNDLAFQQELGRWRLSSGAFSESSDGGMSVDIEEWMIADGLESLHYLTNPLEGAVRIRVGDLRQLGCQVGWDPDSGHPHHGSVWGIKGTRRSIP
jgi:hypothetical protein